MTHNQLLEAAQKARSNAYAPYSGFSVGAALLCENGEVFAGCNVENSSSPAGCCAERSALFSAVSQGERSFIALAVVGGMRGGDSDTCMPCGICLQALSEFSKDLEVITGTEDNPEIYTLNELLPHGFVMRE